MTNKSIVPTKRRRSPKQSQAEARLQKIAATIAELDQLKPKTAKAAKAIAFSSPGWKMSPVTMRKPGRN